MACLNYLGLRVVTSASLLMSESGSGCRYYGKWETAQWYYANWKAKWTCKILGMPRSGEMEVVTTDAPWLMAMATDSHRRPPKRSLKKHIVNVKKIIGDDQAILRVDRNSTNIPHTIAIYVYEIAIDGGFRTSLKLHIGLFLTSTGFCSHQRKIISWRLWPQPKNWDIHINPLDAGRRSTDFAHTSLRCQESVDRRHGIWTLRLVDGWPTWFSNAYWHLNSRVIEI